MPLQKRVLWLVKLSIILLLLYSCSRYPPSEQAIKKAITSSLKHKVPMSWSGSLMGGNNAQIGLIEILQIGEFNKKGQYWPVKARVKGTCQADFIYKTETRSFDRIGNFKLYKDDYVKLKAVIDLIQ